MEDLLQRDLSWRRKEIANLYLAAISTQAESQSRAVRSGILLAYAHLEGFSRYAVRSYLIYIQGRNLSYGELANNLLALKISRMVSQGTAKASYYRASVDLLITALSSPAILPNPDVISAKSNLSYAQFCELLFCVNIDPEPFSLRQRFFDEVLLDRRNAIAHGEFRRPSVDDYIEIHNGVLDLLDKLEEVIVQAAVGERYKRVLVAPA